MGRVPASVFLERLTEELDDLRARGEDLPQTAQAYAADWLAEGLPDPPFSAWRSTKRCTSYPHRLRRRSALSQGLKRRGRQRRRAG